MLLDGYASAVDRKKGIVSTVAAVLHSLYVRTMMLARMYNKPNSHFVIQ